MEGLSTSSPSKHTLIDFLKEKGQPSMFSGFVQSSPPLHETSFFIDSDIDDEDEDTASGTGESFDEESMTSVESSVESLSERSQDTTSPADVLTPNSQADDASPNLIFRLKSIKGREETDTHLFRATLASTQDFDWQTYQPELERYGEPPVPEIPAQFKHEPEHEPQPEPTFESTTEPTADVETDVLGDLLGTPVDREERDERNDVERWTTQQVAAWMYNSGFENSIISTFRTHDVNGAILIDLTFEDLRELDISSFGKRRQIWNEVGVLRVEGARDPLKASAVDRDRGCSYLHGYATPSPTERTRRPGFERRSKNIITGYRRPNRPTFEPPHQLPYQPLDIPRPHRCSKGEKCPKWQQQQCILAEIDREHGPDTPPSGSSIFASPKSSPTITQRNSFATSLSTVIHAPQSAGSLTPTTTSAPIDDSIPPVPPLPPPAPPLQEDPKQEPTTSILKEPVSKPIVQPIVDTQHIVQQYSRSNSVSTTPASDAGEWGVLPTPPEEPTSPHPPRHSSLSGSLPKLNIPPSPVHGPTSSDSTIRYGDAPLLNPSEMAPLPQHRFTYASTPDLVAPPLSPSASSRTQSPSPNLAFITMRPSPELSNLPVHPLRSPSSDSDIPSTLPAVYFKKDSTESVSAAGPFSRPTVLRAAASTDALPVRRQVRPLPTLKEGSLTTNKSKSSRTKPLPETPLLFPALERQLSPPSTAPCDPSQAITPGPRASTFPRSRSISPQKPDSINRQTVVPAAPLNTTFSSTPHSVTPHTPAFTPLPSTPATPAVAQTPRAPSPTFCPDAYGPDILQVGWVRQRRARLWRHEWAPIHLRLTKTQMSLHASARPDDKPLETIKMDEYEVAVSQGAGGNKITSTIQKWRGGNTRTSSHVSIDDTFTFQLVPTAEMVEAFHSSVRGSSVSSRTASQDGSDRSDYSGSEGRGGSAGSREEMNMKFLKSYYFAVRTRDDRIEWMRQLMMARETMARAERLRRKEAVEEGVRAKRSGSF